MLRLRSRQPALCPRHRLSPVAPPPQPQPPLMIDGLRLVVLIVMLAICLPNIVAVSWKQLRSSPAAARAVSNPPQLPTSNQQACAEYAPALPRYHRLSDRYWVSLIPALQKARPVRSEHNPHSTFYIIPWSEAYFIVSYHLLTL